MGVDQPRQHDMSGEVHDRVGRSGQRRAGPDAPDHAVDRIEPAVGDLAALVVHRDHERIFTKSVAILGRLHTFKSSGSLA